MFRSHRVVGPITPDALIESAILAGEYLVRSVQDDGRMVYVYHADTGAAPDEYNILRHAGTTYAMFDLYADTRDEQLLAAANRAVAYLLKHLRPWPQGGQDAAMISFNNRIKLGGAALALVALARQIEVTGDTTHLETAEKLGRYLLSQQRTDGSFISARDFPSGLERDFVSVYYPGEALLALVRLYAIDKNRQWLDAAVLGAAYLIEHRDKDVTGRDVLHDHWLLYALSELNRHRPDDRFVQHARKIVAAIVTDQRRYLEPPDYLGTFYATPRSTPVATRCEGLVAAYPLVRDFGDEQEPQAVLEAVQLAVHFQLQTQFRKEKAMLLADPPRSLGAFHQGLDNYRVRNDFVQHNISAILGLYRLMKSQGWAKLGAPNWKSTRLIGNARGRMLAETAAGQAEPAEIP